MKTVEPIKIIPDGEANVKIMRYCAKVFEQANENGESAMGNINGMNILIFPR